MGPPPPPPRSPPCPSRTATGDRIRSSLRERGGEACIGAQVWFARVRFGHKVRGFGHGCAQSGPATPLGFGTLRAAPKSSVSARVGRGLGRRWATQGDLRQSILRQAEVTFPPKATTRATLRKFCHESVDRRKVGTAQRKINQSKSPPLHVFHFADNVPKIILGFPTRVLQTTVCRFSNCSS